MGTQDLIPGEYILNGMNDIGIDPDIRRYINNVVRVEKKCKSGLYSIRTIDGKHFSVPKGNLETSTEYFDRRSTKPAPLVGWTVEPAKDLQATYGLDLGEKLTQALIANICK